VIASVKYYKSKSSGYTPLLNKLPTSSNNHYGATTAHNNSSDDDAASDNTVTMDIEIKSSRWTIYNWSRLILSMAQLGLFVCAAQKIYQNHYEYSPNEGSKSELLFAYSTRIGFWVRILKRDKK
jgi:hypothetical protein